LRGACIDIGSNTTRLLVADCVAGRLVPVAQERVFTHIALGRRADGAISAAKIEEVARVAAAQLQRAHELGATAVRAVATAAIRTAANRGELARAVEATCGLRVEVLTGREEARLAFVGAVGAMKAAPASELAVVDAGGGSCELAVGRPPDRVTWSASLPLGSAELTRACLPSDPPADPELRRARARIAAALAGLGAPRVGAAVAVGGSAASLSRLAGPVLGAAALERALAQLVGQPAELVAPRVGLEVQRVRLLPAGLLILQAVAERFGHPLAVGDGGLREGVVLELCRGGGAGV
jgi:exopolyphosphatase/guanosine-5'-triphosphate,3'-diphosphate pyrophosphatase